ncbi:MAG TPA: class I SAM-dependent methyltransferase [Longimicrobiales bacterium]|nr:class I SAM-dependent methyltransferase [Longimicrobiales bacterium]
MSLETRVGLLLRAGRNVALGANLAALPLVRRPRELLRYATEALFQRQLEKPGGLPRTPVADFFGLSDGEAVLGNLDGYTWLDDESPPFVIDLLSLILLCRALRPETILEIGTFVGYTALHMALNTPADTRVFTLDLPPQNRDTSLRTTGTDQKLIGKDIGRAVFEGRPAGAKVTRLYGDSASFDFSPWHGAVDLFFVDGAHSYDYVRSDTEKALMCMRPGGVVVWHDYGRIEQDGVTRWLHEFARGRDVRAVPNGSIAYWRVPETAERSGVGRPA